MIICQVRTRLTEKGLLTKCKEIQCKETVKCFVTESKKRIKKESLLVVDTNLLNTLNNSYLEYHTYCLKDDIYAAKKLTIDKVIDRYEELKASLDKLTTGLCTENY